MQVTNYYNNNNYSLAKDKVLNNYDNKKDTINNYVEALNNDSSFNELTKWINARADGTRFDNRN